MPPESPYRLPSPLPMPLAAVITPLLIITELSSKSLILIIAPPLELLLILRIALFKQPFHCYSAVLRWLHWGGAPSPVFSLFRRLRGITLPPPPFHLSLLVYILRIKTANKFERRHITSISRSQSATVMDARRRLPFRVMPLVDSDCIQIFLSSRIVIRLY